MKIFLSCFALYLIINLKYSQFEIFPHKHGHFIEDAADEENYNAEHGIFQNDKQVKPSLIEHILPFNTQSMKTGIFKEPYIENRINIKVTKDEHFYPPKNINAESRSNVTNIHPYVCSERLDEQISVLKKAKSIPIAVHGEMHSALLKPMVNTKDQNTKSFINSVVDKFEKLDMDGSLNGLENYDQSAQGCGIEKSLEKNFASEKMQISPLDITKPIKAKIMTANEVEKFKVNSLVQNNWPSESFEDSETVALQNQKCKDSNKNLFSQSHILSPLLRKTSINETYIILEPALLLPVKNRTDERKITVETCRNDSHIKEGQKIKNDYSKTISSRKHNISGYSTASRKSYIPLDENLHECGDSQRESLHSGDIYFKVKNGSILKSNWPARHQIKSDETPFGNTPEDVKVYSKQSYQNLNKGINFYNSGGENIKNEYNLVGSDIESPTNFYSASMSKLPNVSKTQGYLKRNFLKNTHNVLIQKRKLLGISHKLFDYTVYYDDYEAEEAARLAILSADENNDISIRKLSNNYPHTEMPMLNVNKTAHSYSKMDNTSKPNTFSFSNKSIENLSHQNTKNVANVYFKLNGNATSDKKNSVTLQSSNSTEFTNVNLSKKNCKGAIGENQKN